jgi:hypothetical protein
LSTANQNTFIPDIPANTDKTWNPANWQISRCRLVVGSHGQPIAKRFFTPLL